jgi:hypothetical protein
MIDGLLQADMSSGDPVADWLSRLQKHRCSRSYACELGVILPIQTFAGIA